MFKMPGKAVSLWLNDFYGNIIDKERAKDAFQRTNKFGDPSFQKKIETFSEAVDRLVLKVSYMRTLEEKRVYIAQAPQDIVDILIFRFHWTFAELDTEPGELHFADQPDICAVFRLFLIEDEQIRNTPWPTN